MNVQFAVQARTRLRPRGQPARVAHGAVRQQGDRRAAGEDRGARHGREDARRARLHARDRARARRVKEAVFPFVKFPGVDTVLGPEMKSTGEVMGIGDSFGEAFAKAELAAGTVLPQRGTVFVSVRDEDRAGVVLVARRLARARLPPDRDARDRRRRSRPRHPGRDREQGLRGQPARRRRARKRARSRSSSTRRSPTRRRSRDSFSIRRTALERKIPYFTTIAAAQAAAEAIAALAVGTAHREAVAGIPPRARARSVVLSGGASSIVDDRRSRAADSACLPWRTSVASATPVPDLALRFSAAARIA